MPQFNLMKLIKDVFRPVEEDKVTVMVDMPHGEIGDNKNWQDRRAMAEEWLDGFKTLSKECGFSVSPMVTYPATGAHSADMPMKVSFGDREKDTDSVIRESTLIVSITEYSATAPLYLFIGKYPYLRVASMPSIIRDMEKTAFSVDYGRLANLCKKLAQVLEPAVTGSVKFSTGHTCHFDLRFRRLTEDNGLLPPDKKGVRVINLPSGEVFQVPYEGERDGEPSRTSGDLPYMYGDELVVYRVEGNRIVEIIGNGPKFEERKEYYSKDPARTNIAEFGLGCNENAIMRGISIEDEKAGFHWAYGRSDHLGGICGADQFADPKNVIHGDVVYAKGSPVTVDSIELTYSDGSKRQIWDGEWYTV